MPNTEGSLVLSLRLVGIPRIQVPFPHGNLSPGTPAEFSELCVLSSSCCVCLLAVAHPALASRSHHAPPGHHPSSLSPKAEATPGKEERSPWTSGLDLPALKGLTRVVFF